MDACMVIFIFFSFNIDIVFSCSRLFKSRHPHAQISSWWLLSCEHLGGLVRNASSPSLGLCGKIKMYDMNMNKTRNSKPILLLAIKAQRENESLNAVIASYSLVIIIITIYRKMCDRIIWIHYQMLLNQEALCISIHFHALTSRGGGRIRLLVKRLENCFFRPKMPQKFDDVFARVVRALKGGGV